MASNNVKAFLSSDVAAVFDAYPRAIKPKLLFLRELIFKVAAGLSDVGELEETLKWGQPSYLTSQTKSGSTIRIDWIPDPGNQYAMYFHCQTRLVDTFKEIFPNEFNYNGNRAIIFNKQDKLAIKQLSHCIELALTYHLNKKRIPRQS